MRHGPPIMAAEDRAEPLAEPARGMKGDVMRTLRLSLVGAIICALLGGLNGVALAQDDGDGGPVTHFTGTRLDAVVKAACGRPPADGLDAFVQRATAVAVEDSPSQLSGSGV